MTLSGIKNAVAMIAAEAHDFESAHALQDQLVEEFVRYVATQGGPLARKAKAVIEVFDIDFPRHCA